MLHQPVLLKEAIKYLSPKPGDIILDATIDGGGHARAILEKILPNGKLIGIDQDGEILKNLRIKNQELRIKNVSLINGNFRDLDELLKPLKIKKLDAVLFDLGMSSYHLEKSGRGFTFKKEEPLIMSFKYPLDPGDLTAKEILNSWPEQEIYKILKEYGEERYARRISRNIVKFRDNRKFEITSDLLTAIGPAKPVRTFQALRIAVNDELNALKEGLIKSWALLKPGGRLVVISFHSLEDRIAKNFLKEKNKNNEGKILTKKPITPSQEEIKKNPRSRSAKLRAIEKSLCSKSEARNPKSETNFNN